jgi:hypothetical protein
MFSHYRFSWAHPSWNDLLVTYVTSDELLSPNSVWTSSDQSNTISFGSVTLSSPLSMTFPHPWVPPHMTGLATPSNSFSLWIPCTAGYVLSGHQCIFRWYGLIHLHFPLAIWVAMASSPGSPSRLPSTAVRINHERLPRHCVDHAISLMTSRGQRHILNIASSFSCSHIVLSKFSITSRKIFWSL